MIDNREDYLGIKVHTEDPEYINDFSKKLLGDFYLKEGLTIPQAFAKTAVAFCYGDYELAQRIYDYVYKGWFMYASPVLSNAPSGEWIKSVTRDVKTWDKEYTWVGEKRKDMPISCFALYIDDSLEGQFNSNRELSGLSVAGGGVGMHSSIRAVSDKSPGPIPYLKTMDAIIGYYKQSSVRRGACAAYLDIDHPDILEHIKFRIPTGGDSARKSDNRKQYHNAVNVTQKFIDAVLEDKDFDLKCPHSGEVHETVKARDLWEELLDTRALTGEPYIFKIDTANAALPQTQKDLGLKINGSNICIEIALPTNKDRTFVCCLSSSNLAKWEEWKDTNMIADLTRFLDNTIQYFIDNGNDELRRAIYSAKKERAIGIGAMGLHTLYQSKGLPFSSEKAFALNKEIFKRIKEDAVKESKLLAIERGEPDDMVGSGMRNSALLALAPNSNSGVILNVSPSIEMYSGVAYSHSTRAGTHLVKNPFFEQVMEKVNTDKVWQQEQWKSIISEKGSVQHLDWLSVEDKAVFRVAVEEDQNVIVDQADDRQQSVCQSQSLNLFFPSGVDAGYFNRVHLNAMRKKYLKSLYYCRMNREVSADTVKDVQRKALVDYDGGDCAACEA